MARNTRVNELRAQAKRLERNAGKKISRLRNAADSVDLAGTNFDVRRGSQALGRMRSRDLEVHIRRLTEFNKRTSRFKQTESGIAGPNEVNRFIKAQNRLNRQRKAMMEKYGDLPTALSDETIRQKWGKLDVAQRRMNDPAVNNPMREVDKLGIKYRTPEALIKMAEIFERKSSPEYQSEEIMSQRETIEKMFDVIGESTDDLRTMIGYMTDEQFRLMWNDPDFMSGQGFIYAQVMGRERGELSGDELDAFDDTLGNELYEATKIAHWALQNGLGR